MDGRKKYLTGAIKKTKGERKTKLQSNEFFYDYLKKEIKPKRKMGHLTILKK